MLTYKGLRFLGNISLLGWGTYWLARYAYQLRVQSPSTILAEIRALPPTDRGEAKLEDLDKLWRWLRFIQTRIWRDHKPSCAVPWCCTAGACSRACQRK